MKNGVKKIFSVILAGLMTAGIFAGCAPEQTDSAPHVHTFSESWSSDEGEHWHPSTCGHDVKSGEGAHAFGTDGSCTVCGYHKHVFSSAWTSDGRTHWHVSLCGHNEKAEEAAHTLNADGTACSVCGREAVDHTRKPVSTTPFKDSYEIGNVRVQLLSDTLVRIENRTDEGFENRESYIVTNRLDWEGAEGREISENGVTKIVTDTYTVVIPDGGRAEDASVINADGETLWTFTGMTDTNVYIPSPSDELKSWHFTDSPRIIPSYEGYSATTGNTDPLQGWDFTSNATDVFVFLPQGDYTQFCTDYVNLTGRTEMVNLSTLGFWDSRYYAYTTQTALQQIKDYRDRGYAIDVLVIDTDWRKSTGNTSGMGYDINTDLFPNMAEFLKQCEELGVEICFNDHPTPVNGTTNGLDKDEVNYRNEKLTLLLSLGVDYWWYDRNWSTSLNSFDPEISVYAFGMYAYQWITEDYYNSIADVFEYAGRAVIMGNVDGVMNGEWKYASDLSAHRYSIQWTGDTFSGADDLAQEIYTAILGGAEVGIPYISADLGGHNGNLSEEQYVRWMQYGLLSSIARVHCVNTQPGRMPWVYGETAEEVFKVYQDMRYRLLPLFYALARENYDAGLPVMRRLDVKYPGYAESSRNDEYLLGDYILVAPLSETDSEPLESQKTKPATLFTHDENGRETAGLLGEYIDSTAFSATPKATRTDADINFNWGAGKAHEAMSKTDNFSVKWTGYLNIGEKPARLAFLADDSVKVYIDGKDVVSGNDAAAYYTTPLYAANSRHTIEVRYQELTGDAFIYSFYLEQPVESACYTSREVFFPEGTWIDVWSGERYCGPQTYAVSYPLESSPVFVREGALVALAENGENANAADWSKLTLDVYPSVNFTANTRLYEDDANTVAYKDGKFRTTDITMTYDGNKKAVVVTINAAEGEFDGERAFEERIWNIRVHMNPGWEALAQVKVNGEALIWFEAVVVCGEGRSNARQLYLHKNNRANSSIASAQKSDFDWDKIFEGAGWFHFTGITPALSDNVAEICLEACRKAKEKKITVSCDLNFRKKLWGKEKAGQVMGELCKYVDYCIANEEDAKDVFGIEAEGSDIYGGRLDRDGYISVAGKLTDRFGFKGVAITLRESKSANDNDWSGMFFTDGKAYFGKKYPMHIVDRVGGGDSFGGGFIYAVLQGYSPQETIEFAVAASCLKHSIEGDYNMVSAAEVKALAGGDASGRVQR